MSNSLGDTVYGKVPVTLQGIFEVDMDNGNRFDHKPCNSTQSDCTFSNQYSQTLFAIGKETYFDLDIPVSFDLWFQGTALWYFI